MPITSNIRSLKARPTLFPRPFQTLLLVPGDLTGSGLGMRLGQNHFRSVSWSQTLAEKSWESCYNPIDELFSKYQVPRKATIKWDQVRQWTILNKFIHCVTNNSTIYDLAIKHSNSAHCGNSTGCNVPVCHAEIDILLILPNPYQQLL